MEISGTFTVNSQLTHTESTDRSAERKKLWKNSSSLTKLCRGMRVCVCVSVRVCVCVCVCVEMTLGGQMVFCDSWHLPAAALLLFTSFLASSLTSASLHFSPLLSAPLVMPFFSFCPLLGTVFRTPEGQWGLDISGCYRTNSYSQISSTGLWSNLFVMEELRKRH